MFEGTQAVWAITRAAVGGVAYGAAWRPAEGVKRKENHIEPIRFGSGKTSLPTVQRFQAARETGFLASRRFSTACMSAA